MKARGESVACWYGVLCAAGKSCVLWFSMPSVRLHKFVEQRCGRHCPACLKLLQLFVHLDCPGLQVQRNVLQQAVPLPLACMREGRMMSTAQQPADPAACITSPKNLLFCCIVHATDLQMFIARCAATHV